jgi:hypothetical protein
MKGVNGALFKKFIVIKCWDGPRFRLGTGTVLDNPKTNLSTIKYWDWDSPGNVSR